MAKLDSGAFSQISKRQLLGLGELLSLRHDVLDDAVAFRLLNLQHAAGQHHVLHAGKTDQPRHAHRAPAADEDPALAFGQCEIGRFVGNANLRGGSRFESAAQCRAMQRRDERDIAARHDLEIGVAVELERQALRPSGLPVFGGPAQVEAGAEIVAVTEDDAALASSPARSIAARTLHNVGVEAVALVGTVEPDQGDLAIQLVGDRIVLRS